MHAKKYAHKTYIEGPSIQLSGVSACLTSARSCVWDPVPKKENKGKNPMYRFIVCSFLYISYLCNIDNIIHINGGWEIRECKDRTTASYNGVDV